jgi:hypothetical protein
VFLIDSLKLWSFLSGVTVTSGRWIDPAVFLHSSDVHLVNYALTMKVNRSDYLYHQSWETEARWIMKLSSFTPKNYHGIEPWFDLC